VAAQVKRDGAGLLFIENHYPICAAAAACRGFCASELDIFRSALGPGVTVDRAEHIIAGDRRCVYRIAATK
jgi:predicted ArsR family transcriptional regulator